MISQVWIIRNSGIPLVSRAYGYKIELDETLLTSLFSALVLFAEDLDQGPVEAIIMTNLTFFVSREEEMLFVLGVESHRINEQFIAHIMKQIKQAFYQIFPAEFLEKSKKQPFRIPISAVKTYQQELDLIINQEARTLSRSHGWDVKQTKQTLLAVAKEEISPITAIDMLLDIFDNLEQKKDLDQVSATIEAMLSISEQFTVDSPLHQLLDGLTKFIGLWGKMVKISILGLDRAGKTALINSFQGRTYQTTPTTTLSIERINFRNLTFVCWDIPGQEVYRPQWVSNMRDTLILLFVIDGADPKRWEEAMHELQKILNEFPKIPLALLLNKADLPDYVEKKTFSNVFGTSLKASEQPIGLFETSALTGEGLKDLFQWILRRLAETLPRSDHNDK